MSKKYSKWLVGAALLGAAAGAGLAYFKKHKKEKENWEDDFEDFEDDFLDDDLEDLDGIRLLAFLDLVDVALGDQIAQSLDHRFFFCLVGFGDSLYRLPEGGPYFFVLVLLKKSLQTF